MIEIHFDRIVINSIRENLYPRAKGHESNLQTSFYV